MASSRIFVKGLPPTFTEPEFKKHFSHNREVTDVKIFPNRRIGYVGYKTPEDAQKAVKYFNKTFIRMSRIGVELARPVQDAKTAKHAGSTPPKPQSIGVDQADARENGLKRKRGSQDVDEQDPKLKEFLEAMKPKSKKRAWEVDTVQEVAPAGKMDSAVFANNAAGGEEDSEYEEIPKTRDRGRSDVNKERTKDEALGHALDVSLSSHADEAQDGPAQSMNEAANPAISDSDWARSRTSRLLGLVDDDDDEEEEASADQPRKDPSLPSEDEENPENDVPEDQQDISTSVARTGPEDGALDTTDNPDADANPPTTRLFVRNLPYEVKPEHLEDEFGTFGPLEEVHVPVDTKSGTAKGFAYIHFADPDSAQAAIAKLDGSIFQGRLLHVLPAKTKQDSKLDEFALSKLPLKKQQQIRRRREAASSTFNWNALFMNADAVVSSVADRLGLSKSDVLDPTSSDAAVKQAHAETHVIQETKAYFQQQGVDLDAFKRSQRGDTAILVKNIPYDCSRDELRRLFEEYGELKRFLMPPSGTLAVLEFGNPAQCKTAFGALAYRKVKGSVLFLEKAPKGLFDAKSATATVAENDGDISKTSASELKESDHVVPETHGTATLFIRNLNFTTSSQLLTDTFGSLDGFLSARVKTKTDPKKPGQVLSMGFGFLEFRTSQQAQSALKAMDGYTLEGHKLQLRASHKGVDAAEERRRADAEKKAAGRKTKVVIKNIPFEATKKDIRALFGAYGQLRGIRLPKKMNRAGRGFAFADFTTPKEAENAINALKDTHLLGRRLVLDFADEDPEDAEAEIEKMQQKVGSQVNKVALQKLTSGGRKKFSTQNDEDVG